MAYAGAIGKSIGSRAASAKPIIIHVRGTFVTPKAYMQKKKDLFDFKYRRVYHRNQ